MKSRHFLLLAIVLLLGTGLRFWNLDLKPLWLDEVITALISLGRGYKIVPLESAFPLSALDQILTLKPETTCAQITNLVTTQSVHPPLFFCWLHDWLNWLAPISASLVWKLRSLPALAGVGMIAAVYFLNRVAFSPPAGLFAAMAMAVSPFAVYLSQEARHYTIPMLLITLALAGLVRILQGLSQSQRQLSIWLGWVAVNALGFYVHYFFVLAFVAQVGALLLVIWRSRYAPSRRQWAEMGCAIGAVVVSYLFWLPTFLSHMTRPETDWLKATDPNYLHLLAPLYQLPIGWLTMLVVLPIENQPLWVAIPTVLVVLLLAGWLVRHLLKGLKQLLRDPITQPATTLLLGFVACVLLEFLIIIYILGKDISVVPRYNFVYYPAVGALVGASLSKLQARKERSIHPIAYALLLIGLVSSTFVVNDLAFQKSYSPRQTATQLSQEPEVSHLVAMGYQDLQDVALGLSFAIEMHRMEVKSSQVGVAHSFTFLPRSQGYEPFWQKLQQLQFSPITRASEKAVRSPLNLWIIAPELKRSAFPAELSLSAAFSQNAKQLACKIAPNQHYRIGIPFQLYRCQN
jgi:uncharacterized membrane protein